MKHIKVTLTNDRTEIIEFDHPVSAEAWLGATRRGGSKFVVLNGTSYPKEDLIDAVEVKATSGSTNMEGV